MDLIINKPRDAISTLIFAHGAGAPMDSEWMSSVSELFESLNVKVIRFNYPYMHRRKLEGRKFPPDRVEKLLRHTLGVIKYISEEGLLEGKLFIGGKSMGARVACMIEHAPITGNICFGFPFFPPGRKDIKRLEILNQTSRPTLINQGERDPFGGREWLENQELSERIELNYIDDGDHDLKPRVRSGLTKRQNLTKSVADSVRFIESKL